VRFVRELTSMLPDFPAFKGELLKIVLAKLRQVR
jgi:hypothetical protein